MIPSKSLRFGRMKNSASYPKIRIVHFLEILVDPLIDETLNGFCTDLMALRNEHSLIYFVAAPVSIKSFS